VGQARARRDSTARLLTRYGQAVPSPEKREKLDKELIELLNELRVALPGVQVLFAFLLIVPFNSSFEADQKPAYMVALSATLLATALLIAPSAYHRLRWRERDKERMLRVSNWLAIAGIAAVAVAMTASVYLVTDVLFDTVGTVLCTVASAIVFALGWFALPLSAPYDRWDDDDDA
jgi:amino acid transporter